MAEVIGIASSLLTLAGFALQSSQVLIQTLHSFQSSKKHVRELKAELEALVSVLESVQELCKDTDVDFSPLKYPVSECGKACKEFEEYITKYTPRSDQDRRSFRDWANLTLRGDTIEGFKDKLAANKATITIALADANL
jgi:STAND-like protein